MKISFIGSGKMAEALISGITESNTLSPNSINCTDKDDKKTTYMNEKYNINKFTNNLDVIQNADIIFICIKPQDIKTLSNELKNQFKNNQTIVSILAGTQIQTLSKLFNHNSIIRIMPNTPAQIKKSVSVWTHTKETDSTHIKQIKSILASIGSDFYVEKEELIDEPFLSKIGWSIKEIKEHSTDSQLEKLTLLFEEVLEKHDFSLLVIDEMDIIALPANRQRREQVEFLHFIKDLLDKIFEIISTS